MMPGKRPRQLCQPRRFWMLSLLLLACALGVAGRPARFDGPAQRPDVVPPLATEAPAIPGGVGGGTPPDSKHGLSEKDRIGVFEKVWKVIEDRYYDPTFRGVDWQEVRRRYRPLVEAAKNDDEFYDLLKQMTGELHDAHTRFNTPVEWEERKKHEGVGLGFAVEEIDGKQVVSAVARESEAARSGLKPGMILRTIDGQPIAARIAQVKAKRPASSSDRADNILWHRELLGGSAGSAVRLGLERADGSTFQVRLTRQIYPAPAQLNARLLPSGDGYIRFDEFARPVIREFKKVLEQYRNAPGLIIDLRYNGGGTLDAVISIAGYFLKQKTLFAKDATRTGKPLSRFWGLAKLGLEVYAGKDGGQIYSRPVAILIQARTASASEVFAGGLQEMGRAKIVGSQSCGCVLGIAGPRRVKGGGELEVSEVLWLTPKGRKLEGEGIIPDTTVLPTIADLRKKRDAVLEEAEKKLKEAAAARAALREP